MPCALEPPGRSVVERSSARRWPPARCTAADRDRQGPAAVNTPSAPGTARAPPRCRSARSWRARAASARPASTIVRRKSISSMNRPRPVRKRASSSRRSDWPMKVTVPACRRGRSPAPGPAASSRWRPPPGMPFLRRSCSRRNSISPGYSTSVKPLRGRRRLQVLGELGHLPFEGVQIAEGGDVEHGDEAAVVVPSRSAPTPNPRPVSRPERISTIVARP